MMRNVNFTWSFPADPTITKWHLYEVFPSAPRVLLSSGLQNSQRSLIVALDDAVAHAVVVTAENAGGESPASNTDVVPAVLPPPPAAPTNLTHTLV